MWSPETMAFQARSQAAGLVLKESAFWQRLGCKLWWVPSLSTAAYKAGAFFSPSPHSTLSKCKVLWTLVCSQSCAIII